MLSAHARHQVIRHEQIERRAGIDYAQSLFRADRLDHFKAEVDQQYLQVRD